MTKPRVIFFCGERSPWGHAHIEPLLSESRLELAAVVLATENRWSVFRQALSGEDQPIDNRVDRMRRNVTELLRRRAPSSTEITVDLLNKYNIPIEWCDDTNAVQAIDVFCSYQADLLLSAAYPQIFKPEILSNFALGAFNSHPSLLPRCRGAHPVFWAIASGETKSGSTIHFMTKELDSGDIVAQIEVALSSTDTYSRLYANLIHAIPDLVSQFADFITAPGAQPRAQNHEEATYFKNDRRIHHRIFWSEMDAVQIHNLVRACDGSAYFWHQRRLAVVKTVEISRNNRNMSNGIKVPPGTVVEMCENKPVIAAIGGFVTLTDFTVFSGVFDKFIQRPGFAVGQVLG